MKRFRNSKFYFSVMTLVILSMLSLSACSSSGTDHASGPAATASQAPLDAQADYVKAYLDTLCREDYKAYAAAHGVTEEEVRAEMPSYLEDIVENDLTYIPSETMTASFAKELQKLLAKCRYTVQPSKKNEDGTYSVPVSIQQFTVFKESLVKSEEEHLKWVQTQSEDLDEDLSTDQFFTYIIKHCEEILKRPQYARAATVTVTLSPSESDKNVYDFGDEDIENLLYALLDFSAWDEDVADEGDTDEEDADEDA